MKKIIFAISAIAVFTVACTKMANNPIGNVDYKHISSKVTEVYKAQFEHKRNQLPLDNPLNQYDFVGQMHNIGLESFVNNYQQIVGLVENNQMNFGTLIQSNTLYLGQNVSINQFNMSLINSGTLHTYLKNIGATNSSYIDALNTIAFQPSEEFKNLYLQMLNAADMINKNDENSFSTYLNLIKTIEDNIQTAPLLNNEKEILLAASSVARYSGGYWFYETSIASWNPNNIQLASMPAVVKADIAGGVGGGAAGALIGGTVTIPVGGIGAVPGWVAGAITGAVGGSVTQAVFDFLDWMFG